MAGVKYQRSTRILANDLGDGEVVMMDTEAARYFGVAESASAVWKVFETASTVDEVVAVLLSQYDVEPEPCRADVERFVADLVENDLLVAVD